MSAKLSDHRSLELNEYLFAQKSIPIMQIDVSKVKQDLKTQIQSEKADFLEKLNNQEKIIKKEPNRRIFSVIDEIQEIKMKENAFLDDSTCSKMTPELKFQMDQKRKEIYVLYANLKPQITLSELQVMVPKFETLKEAQKREIFRSLEMGKAKELAKVSLYQNETGSSNKIEESTSRAAKFEDLLKSISPEQIQYDSLQMILDKKTNIDKIFDDATQQVEERIAKIEEIQAQLKGIDTKAATEKFYRGIIEQKLMNENAFKEKSVEISKIKKAIEEFPEKDMMQLREIEKDNQKAQNAAEYEAQQMRNLLLMVSKNQLDLGVKMRKIQFNNLKREEFVKNKNAQPTDKITIKSEDSPSYDPIFLRRDFLARLKQFDVDPIWLKNQQISLLNKKTQEEDQKIFEMATEMEERIIIKEAKKMLKMIAPESQKHLLAQIRSQSYLEGVGEDSIVNQLVMASLEAKIQGNEEFYTTEFLMEMIKKDQESKVAKPSRTVFDEVSKDTKKWLPANESDQIYSFDSLTYENYKYNQLLQLKDLEEEDRHLDSTSASLGQHKLLDCMSTIKRDAWLHIYNNWLQTGRQQSGSSFLELFRNWEETQVVSTDFSMLNLNPRTDIYAEDDMSTAEEYKENIRGLINRTEIASTKALKSALGYDEAEYDKNFLALEQGQRSLVQEQLNNIKVAKDQFKLDFGHEVNEKVRVKLDIMAVDAPGATPDGKGRFQTIQNMQLLDDSLVRKIITHLRDPKLRITRISDQIGALVESDNIFGMQKFDVEGYEKLNAQMTPLEQQKVLVAELKKKQEDIQKSLQRRDMKLASLLRKDKDTKSAETAEDVNQQLEQVEGNVRRRLAAEEQGKEQEKSTKDPVQQVMEKIDAEKKFMMRERLSANDPIKEYIENDKFGVYQVDQQVSFEDIAGQKSLYLEEEKKMMELISAYKEFDLEYIVGPKNLSQLQYTGEPPLDTVGQIVTAHSSAQIKEAAATQKLSPADQKLAMLYNPLNPKREEQLKAKFQMLINRKMKEDFAQQILIAQAYLEDVNFQRERFRISAENQSKRFASDVPPMKVFDFIQHEKNISTVNKSAEIVDRLGKFDPKSREVQNYNDELRHQLELRGKDFEQQFEFILQQMSKNAVTPDLQTRAMLFSKSVLDQELDQATISLKKLVDSKMMYSHTQVKVEDLNSFFEQCLKKDNFDGLAHLASYVERYQIDISKWEMSRFRSAIDFYLNHSFDINKLLTFSRFYIHFANSQLVNSSEFSNVFGELESLVDMNALFSYLVEKVGTKTFIDPMTKEDPIQNLIEFFAQPEIQEISKLSNEGTTFISIGDIAKYLGNHLEGSFKKTSDVILKYQASSISSQVIQQLKQFQANKKQLPTSFNTENVRKLYLEIKSTNFQLEEKSAEYLLFLFKSLGMVAESIDLCQNYQSLVKEYESEAAASKSEIRNYYMAESLMDLPLARDNHYYQLLEQAVFQEKNESPSCITSMTKAYFMDGNVEHALKYFEQGIVKRRNMSQNQEEMLVNLYDQIFGEKQSMDLELFKEKYLSLMISRDKLKKEVKAADLLQGILSRCDHEEIEQIFVLQIVLKQEKSLLKQIADVNGADFDLVYNHYDKAKNIETFFKDFGKNNQKALKELKTVRDRKHVLQSSIQQQNIDSLVNMMDVQDGEQVELFGQSQSLSEALSKLGVTPEEYAQYKQYKPQDSIIEAIKKDLKVQEVDSAERDSRASLFAFKSVLDETIERKIAKKDKELAMVDQPLIPAVDMLEEFEEEYGIDVEEMIDRANLAPDGRADEDDLTYIQLYKEFLYKDAPEAEYEEDVIKGEVFEDMIQAHSNDLVSSVGGRREKTLGFAIETFNSIQGKKAPLFYGDQLNLTPQEAPMEFSVADSKTINQTADRFEYLLHDKESPIISNFLSLVSSGEIPQDFSSDSVKKYLKEAEKMETLMEHLQQMNSGMQNMQVDIQNIIEKQEKTKQWKIERQEKVQKMVEGQVKEMYDSFVQSNSLGLKFEGAAAGGMYPSTLNRDQKINMMKQCLSLEGFKPLEIFDSFYSQDLIIFGMKQNIPEAVRLGEKMLGENNQSLPFEMVKAVKNYKLSNNQKYADAIKRTGPINTASVYLNNRPQGVDKNSYSRSSMINMDDPYWQEFMEKNYRKQDAYKVPSAMAWDHKENGILGEIIDIKKMEKNAQEFARFN